MGTLIDLEDKEAVARQRSGGSVTATVDANVLLYASDQASPFHTQSLELVGRLARGPEIVYVFWPTIMAYLRIATHPAVFRRPLSIEEAVNNVEDLVRRPHVQCVGEGDRFWQRRSRGHQGRDSDRKSLCPTRMWSG